MKYIITENQYNKLINERKNNIFKQCWYDANIGDVISEDIIYQYVQYLHRSEEDFYDGDLGDRIEQFEKYILKNIPILDINIDEFELEEHYLESYIKKYGESWDYPPIVLDGDLENGKFTIIDGNHRVNALNELKFPTVRAWVGIEYKDYLN
jgi:ParB-like nuclease domain